MERREREKSLSLLGGKGVYGGSEKAGGVAWPGKRDGVDEEYEEFV